MSDVNDAARRQWEEQTTAAERVEGVLETTRTGTPVSEFAERALVSEPTARKYLEQLVERGVAEADRDGRATTYRRDETAVVTRRIEELRESTSREELLDGIRRMKEEVAGYREQYGVESPEELARLLDDGEDGWTDLGEWRATRKNLAIAQAALSVDEAHRLAEA